MEKDIKFEYMHMNIGKFRDLDRHLHCNESYALNTMIMESLKGEFPFKYKGTANDLAKDVGVTPRTINRYIRHMEQVGMLVPVAKNEWMFGSYFERDEEFEKETGSPPYSCIRFPTFEEDDGEDEYYYFDVHAYKAFEKLYEQYKTELDKHTEQNK